MYEILSARGIPLLIGVIPFHYGRTIPKSHCEFLRTAVKDPLVEIALHGYRHKKAGSMTGEFAGLPAQEQREKIKTGKARVEEIAETPVTIFVPPWNAYDRNTVRSLEDEGFNILSAAGWGKAYDSALAFIPGTCRPNQTWTAVRQARKLVQHNPVIVTVLHMFDFSECGHEFAVLSFDEFETVCEHLEGAADLLPTTFQDMASSPTEFDNHRLDANRRFRRIRLRFGDGLSYLDRRGANQRCIQAILTAGLLSLAMVSALVWAIVRRGNLGF